MATLRTAESTTERSWKREGLPATSQAEAKAADGSEEEESEEERDEVGLSPAGSRDPPLTAAPAETLYSDESVTSASASASESDGPSAHFFFFFCEEASSPPPARKQDAASRRAAARSAAKEGTPVRETAPYSYRAARRDEEDGPTFATRSGYDTVGRVKEEDREKEEKTRSDKRWRTLIGEDICFWVVMEAQRLLKGWGERARDKGGWEGGRLR